MSNVSNLLGGALVAATLPGTAELLFLTLGGALGTRRRDARTPRPLAIAVVVPAHDESAGIADCVRSLLSCDAPEGSWRVHVVADNCTDDTAAAAREAGAEVLERVDPERRGKGYALDFAFGELMARDASFDAFVVVDADSSVDAGFARSIEAALAGGAEAIQARYTAKGPAETIRARLQDLALTAFNVVRPRARERFGLSVGIGGNGFALRREVLEAHPYVARSIVEDLEYHLALVRGGVRVCFLEHARVEGDMPQGTKAAAGQRTRWEGGRFRMIREHAPGLALEVLRGRLRLLEPLLELLLLPLAFHASLLAVTLAVPATFARAYAAAGLGVLALHVAVALVAARARPADVAALAAAPFYLLWKLRLLPRLLAGASRRTSWVRTERES